MTSITDELVEAWANYLSETEDLREATIRNYRSDVRRCLHDGDISTVAALTIASTLLSASLVSASVWSTIARERASRAAPWPNALRKSSWLRPRIC